MPYETKVSYGQVSTEMTFNGEFYTVASQSSSTPAVTHFARSGLNNSEGIAAAKKRRSANAVYEWVPTLIRRGPKLLGYQWSKRLKKMVRRRGVSHLVWRLKRVGSKALPKPVKGLDCPANPLSYSEGRFDYYGSKEPLVVKRSDGIIASYSGDLTLPFRPELGLFSLPDNPSQYTSPFSVDGHILGAINRASDIAISRLYEKAKNQSVNLAMALAERKQLTEMLVQVAGKLLSFYRKLKRGNFYAAAAELFPKDAKGLANVHLMYRYGVKPLISDLEGVVKALATDQDVYYEIITAKTEKIPEVLVNDITSNIRGVSCRTRVYMSGKAKVLYRYRVRIASQYDSLIASLSAAGFGNPNSLAYELIPFSFVVDWFIPIGDYLNKMDAFAGLSIDQATKTVTTETVYRFEREFTSTEMSGYTTVSGTGVRGLVSRRFTCDRSLMTSPPALPTPDFSATTAMMQKNFLTALALIIQLKR